MPTLITHGLIAVLASERSGSARKLPMLFAALFCSIAPDLDVISFKLGIPYENLLGHRGITHSILFAVVLGLLANVWASKGLYDSRRIWWGRALLLIFVALSHCMMDAFTNGGLGVAFFAPFDESRYFFSWRPIKVSPLGISFLLSNRAIDVFLSEARYVWIPALLLWACIKYRIGDLLKMTFTGQRGGIFEKRIVLATGFLFIQWIGFIALFSGSLEAATGYIVIMLTAFILAEAVRKFDVYRTWLVVALLILFIILFWYHMAHRYDVPKPHLEFPGGLALLLAMAISLGAYETKIAVVWSVVIPIIVLVTTAWLDSMYRPGHHGSLGIVLIYVVGYAWPYIAAIYVTEENARTSGGTH